METFKKIDWHPALEDMLDSVFIRDERMHRESAIYNILSDNFKDPFEDLEHEYEKVDIELIKRLGGDELEKEVQSELEAKDADEDNSAAKNVIEEQTTTMDVTSAVVPARRTKFYIPGIRKLPFAFPRKSHLDKNQQAMCLSVLLRLSSNKKRIMTETERTELQNYMSLQKIISKEQTKFSDFVENKWDEDATLFRKCHGFINAMWKLKMREIRKLPKCYAECTNIPFSTNDDVKLKFIRYLRKELPSIIKLPKLGRLNNRKLLTTSGSELSRKFIHRKKPQKVFFSSSVSEDTYCESLANETKVDLVISSSGLKCLLNNIDTAYSNSWLIPVVIKQHNGKNVVYVDKRLPPTTATVPQKNTWVYKRIIRFSFIPFSRNQPKQHFRVDEDKRAKCVDIVQSDNDGGEDSFDELLKAAKENLCTKQDKPGKTAASLDASDASNDHFEIAKDDKSEKAAVHLNADDDSGSASDRLEIDESNLASSSISCGGKESSYSTRQDDESDTNPEMINIRNASYSLFKIVKPSQNYDERRHAVKYKILVRSKLDGAEMSSNRKLRPLVLSAKLEHQLGFGAEAVSLEEGLHEWTSLRFRPEAALARVRIEADTGEVIQIERPTATSLNSEIQRLHDVKTEDSLKILYNVIEKLSVLAPGRYIVQHIPKHGAFACVYKETDKLQKKVILNLDTIYKSNMFETLSSTPWPPIDKMLTTPWIKYMMKMPAMFNPDGMEQPQTSRPKENSPKEDDKIRKGR